MGATTCLRVPSLDSRGVEAFRDEQEVFEVRRSSLPCNCLGINPSVPSRLGEIEPPSALQINVTVRLSTLPGEVNPRRVAQLLVLSMLSVHAIQDEQTRGVWSECCLAIGDSMRIVGVGMHAGGLD